MVFIIKPLAKQGWGYPPAMHVLEELRQLSGGCIPNIKSNLAPSFTSALPRKYLYLPGTRNGLSALPAEASVKGQNSMVIKFTPALYCGPKHRFIFCSGSHFKMSSHVLQ